MRRPLGPLASLVIAWSASLAPFVVLAGCYDSHARVSLAPAGDAGVACDPDARPLCAAREGPCEPLVLVEARCELATWSCPDGASAYEPPWTEDLCLPLRGRVDPIFADGVHEAPVPVPIGETCAWVLPLDRGTLPIDLVASASARRCADIPLPGAPIADLEGDLDYAAIQAAITLHDRSVRVLARGWAYDPSAPFGVRGLGAGLGRVIGDRIAIDDRWLFREDLELGDAAVVHEGFAYAYGCPGAPTWLEEDCIVGRAPLDRVDDPSAWSVLGTAGWGMGDPARVFGSGPHRSSVVRDPRGRGFLHVFAIGFGRELQFQWAPAPEGPFTGDTVLAPCELPPDDPGAYCAGPVVHRELLDPLAPGVLVVGYSVGTTSEDGAERRARDPDGYWPRIVRVPLP